MKKDVPPIFLIVIDNRWNWEGYSKPPEIIEHNFSSNHPRSDIKILLIFSSIFLTIL